MTKIITLFVILIYISSYAEKQESNPKLLECDKFAPHGQQTTAFLFGGGGLMLLGGAIAAFTSNSDDSYNFLAGLACSIIGTTFTGLSIGFQVTSIKSWHDYKNCMISKENLKNFSMNIKSTIPIQIKKNY